MPASTASPNWSLWGRVAKPLGQVLASLAHRHARPGWRRRGCRRPPRTGRTARNRRSATRRPDPAGPVWSRDEGLPRRALRTGASCFAGRGTCEVEERLSGEGVVSRVQGRKPAHQLEDVSVAGEPAEPGEPLQERPAGDRAGVSERAGADGRLRPRTGRPPPGLLRQPRPAHGPSSGPGKQRSHATPVETVGCGE